MPFSLVYIDGVQMFPLSVRNSWNSDRLAVTAAFVWSRGPRTLLPEGPFLPDVSFLRCSQSAKCAMNAFHDTSLLANFCSSSHLSAVLYSSSAANTHGHEAHSRPLLRLQRNVGKRVGQRAMPAACSTDGGHACRSLVLRRRRRAPTSCKVFLVRHR